MSVLLNMDPGAPPVVVTASEGDIGRIFTFQLIKDGMPCSYPSATVTAEILKSDGHGTSIPCAWSGSEVVMVTTEQSTIRAGKASCELRIVSDSYNIGTANFILAVEPRPINADTDQTDSSYSQTGDPGDVWTLGSNGVPSWSPSGLDASTATAGQVLTADGAGGHYWGDIEAGDSVPTEVRQAIFNLLDNNAFANDDTYTADLAVLESWASVATAISVTPSTASISDSSTRQLTAVTTPAGASVSWASSDTSVATVSSSGLVTGVGNGTCTITATSGSVSATCVITVTGFANLTSISAVYTQSGTVYDSDSLDSLKSDLVVTGTYDNSTTRTITDYTLSGTLTEGTSTITVSYAGFTDSFTVTVTSATLYSLTNHTFNNADPIATGLKLLENDRDITFVFDVDFAGQQSNSIWKLFGCINGSGNYEGVTIYAYANGSNNALIQNMSNRITLAYDLRNYVGNFKYITTHEAGTDEWHYYYKIGSSSVVDAIDTSPFVSVTGQLTIGGTASGSQVFNGTVNTAKVYSKVLTESEINAFME